VVIVILVLLVIGYGILEEQVIRYRRPVAEINGERISAQDFRNFTKYYRYTIIRDAENNYQLASMFGSDQATLQSFLSQLQNSVQQLDTFVAGESAINQMVENALVMQEAKKRGISVSDEEIDQRLQEALGFSGTPIPPVPAATSTTAPISMVTITVTALTPTQHYRNLAIRRPWSQARRPAHGYPESSLIDAHALYLRVTKTFCYDGGSHLSSAETIRSIIENALYRERLQKEIVGVVACEEEQVWAQHILVEERRSKSQGKVDAGKIGFHC
jgi:hypothetical protein